MIRVNDIAITSLETITAFGLTTGNYLFTLDELQNASIAQAEETQDITGKQGRKITSIKRSKTVTVSGTNGLFSGGLLATQVGSEFENKVTEVLWTDYIEAANDGATTTYAAVGTTGNEIESIYVKNTDGTLGAQMTQNSAVGEGQFTYDPSSKAIAFKAGEVEDGAELVVMYKRRIQADVLENNSDVYSTKASLYIDAIGEDVCGKIYRIQFFIPKANFSGEFSFEMGDAQSVHSFTAEAMAGACGLSGSLWTYTVFGNEAEDA